MPDIAIQALLADAARLRPLVSEASLDPRPKGSRDSSDESDETRYLSVGVLRRQYIDYLTGKEEEIDEQKMSRRYYHAVQITGEEAEILRRRHQPVMIWNRIARKINGIAGLMERMRSDPKSEPTTPESEQGADIATHVIRYVLDRNEFKTIEPRCVLQSEIDGISGVQLILKRRSQDDIDIDIKEVVGDEFFYDPTSYKSDFSDCGYMGISKLMYVGDAVTLFPDKEELLLSLVQGDSDLTTNPDREIKWIVTATKRVRLIEHWYRHDGKWCWAFYISNVILDEGESPFFDEDGKTISSFQMFSAGVDHEGDRYGFVRNFKGPQDSLNQSKSKQLHIANSRRLIADKGAVDDVEKARIEWARPDGFIEKNPGLDIMPDQTSQDLAAFSKFAEDAQNELDSYANVNIAAMSGVPVTQISGRAIELLRQPGMAELGLFSLAIRGWKLQLYKAIWNTCQRYWSGERWIRVTNNQGLKQFIQLNGVDLDPMGRPTLINALGAVNVNITFEEGRDVGSLMEETADYLKGFPPGTFPPQVIIELLNIPQSDKARILQMMTPKPPPPNPVAEAAQKLQLENMALRNAKTAAEAHKTEAAVEQVLATAQAQRAKVGESAARAGHLASQSHLDAAEFARDSYREAHEIMQHTLQPQQAPPGPQLPGMTP